MTNRYSYLPRTNSKEFKKYEGIIESTRQMMIEEYGLDKKIIINNKLPKNINGRIIIVEEREDGVVNEFGNIEIRTASQTVQSVIKLIVHEFTHILYSNCHTDGIRSNSKNAIADEDTLHRNKTEELTEMVIEELGLN